ncbi:MAG: 4-hydroxythreonine-4-phosphate dehydrogenase PdxA [Verrucomicrobia bacterium]|nr:4-hydroxythreonine-4-phosphate dehydrogenase PdxA [Verrucomicrobiota bacterium]
MGDPAGVGPEICLRLMQNKELLQQCVPIIFGDAEVLELSSSLCDLPFPEHISTDLNSLQSPGILDLKAIHTGDFKPGTVNAKTGSAAYTYLTAAIDAAQSKQIDAITTAPLNKLALNQAGINFPGHTEILADRTQSTNYCMMLTSQNLTCSFVTAHVGYEEVPALLTRERILDNIKLTHQAMQQLRGCDPKIVICGLNPHAGEQGLFGNREEEKAIIPATEAARELGIDIEGPFPPDTVFLKWRREQTDAFICMYHDQGHIPFKALAFEEGVNITLGLPIIRTSVDHGTALDIAWKGVADATSLNEAVRLASRLALN